MNQLKNRITEIINQAEEVHHETFILGELLLRTDDVIVLVLLNQYNKPLIITTDIKLENKDIIEGDLRGGNIMKLLFPDRMLKEEEPVEEKEAECSKDDNTKCFWGTVFGTDKHINLGFEDKDVYVKARNTIIEEGECKQVDDNTKFQALLSIATAVTTTVKTLQKLSMEVNSVRLISESSKLSSIVLELETGRAVKTDVGVFDESRSTMRRLLVDKFKDHGIETEILF